jgi:NodT family efflux transporter outer membrane factor (OMF) lipoprotein
LKRAPRLLLATLLVAAPLAGCEVGPDYHRPNTAVPLTYKELPNPPPGWQFAKPADGAGGGAWWTVFNDPDLDALEQRVNVNNQTIKESEAAYREARALIGEARAGLFPTIGVTGSATKQHADRFTTSSGTAEATASWDLDVWGKIRRDIESARAGAQASAADLANAQLSEQATLATTYFDLCYQDALIAVLRQTVAAYQRSLDITNNQDQFGVAQPTDVITAKTQLEGAQSQLVAAGVQRAEYEHAIAELVGVPPVDLSLSPRQLPSSVPTLPVSIPSTLLQRRPDIAAAERTMQQENAQIGVNIAAFYPDVSLSAAVGYSGSPIGMLFNASNYLWNLGGTVTETIFEGGLRAAQVEAARATYDQSVASYRQTVLNAFQSTEDNISALRILAQQYNVQAQADADAQRAVTIALNEYEAGTQAYTTVITEQTILLSDQETLLQIEQSRLNDTVTLAEDLGGGWDISQLPLGPHSS